MKPVGDINRTRLSVGCNDKVDETFSASSSMVVARAAQVRWLRIPLSRRLKMVRELRRLIAAQAIQLAEASAAARGRPVLESLTAEVLPLAEACRFLERTAEK